VQLCLGNGTAKMVKVEKSKAQSHSRLKIRLAHEVENDAKAFVLPSYIGESPVVGEGLGVADRGAVVDFLVRVQ
jgi:hypothetical protein